MMYYAKQVDNAQAKLLFDATLTEYEYRLYYGLDIGDLFDDDDTSHFDISDLQ